MGKRRLIILAASPLLLFVAGLILYAIAFASYGPRAIAPGIALNLLNQCEGFSSAGTREAQSITGITPTSPSEVSNYYADVKWLCRCDLGRTFVSIAEFEYREDRWYLTSFQDEGGRWLDSRCGTAQR